MEDQVLSIEQMNVLSKLGVDCSKASVDIGSVNSIEYNNDGSTNENEFDICFFKPDGIKPTCLYTSYRSFTIYDLMMLLPEYVVIKRKKIEFTLYLKVEKDSATNWCVSYENDDLFLFSHSTSMLITSVYNMVITCVQEGYIKTK